MSDWYDTAAAAAAAATYSYYIPCQFKSFRRISSLNSINRSNINRTFLDIATAATNGVGGGAAAAHTIVVVVVIATTATKKGREKAGSGFGFSFRRQVQGKFVFAQGQKGLLGLAIGINT